MKNNTKQYIRKITYIALFVAIISVLAQISIPISVVPITLQVFAVCLCGFILDTKCSVIAICAYLMLGTVGAPVFASFNGGFHVLLSYTGGFLWGFIPLALLCSISKSKKAIPLGIIGLFICHIIGIIQYSFVSNVSVWLSFIAVSLPYIAKDIILLILAYFVGERINKILKKHL